METIAQSFCGIYERPRDKYFLELMRRPGEKAPDDPQQQRVYDWQRDVIANALGHDEPLLGADERGGVTKTSARAAAVQYLTDVWNRHARTFAPFFTGVPQLRIGFPRLDSSGFYSPRNWSGAHACALRHSIYVRLDSLKRSVIVHEVAHILGWRGRAVHGPHFCRILMHLLIAELGVFPTIAFESAIRHGVEIEQL